MRVPARARLSVAPSPTRAPCRTSSPRPPAGPHRRPQLPVLPEERRQLCDLHQGLVHRLHGAPRGRVCSGGQEAAGAAAQAQGAGVCVCLVLETAGFAWGGGFMGRAAAWGQYMLGPAGEQRRVLRRACACSVHPACTARPPTCRARTCMHHCLQLCAVCSCTPPPRMHALLATPLAWVTTFYHSGSWPAPSRRHAGAPDVGPPQ